MANLTASDLDKLSEEYSAPEIRGKTKTMPGFESQQEAADFVKDAMTLAATGATFGTGEELLAGAQTGSFVSPEYKQQRDIYRGKIQEARQNLPLLGPLIEAGAGEAVSTALPGGRIIKGLATSALSGAGEAPEMGQVPAEAAKSVGLQLVGEGALAALKATPMIDDPTKILTRSVGVGQRELKGPEAKTAIGTVERLNKVGFFKQGEVGINPTTQRFERRGIRKDLTGFLKPQTLDSLVERASKTKTALIDYNKKLIKGKFIPEIEFQRAVYSTLQEMTDPSHYNIEERYNVARKILDVVEKDLKYSLGKGGTKMIPAESIMERKRAVDKFLKDPAFEKQLSDLGIDKQSLMSIRTNLDKLLDSVGSDTFKKNNELISDLIDVEDLIRSKERKSYIDTGTRLVDNRSMMQKILEGISPTWMDIARSDIATGLATKPGQFVERAAIRVPGEALVKDTGIYPIGEQVPPEVPQYNIPEPGFSGVLRKPQSLMRKPQSIKVPRKSEEVLKNKQAFLMKAGMLGEDVDALTEMLNNSPSKLPDVLKYLAMKHKDQMFQDSEYNIIDGKFVDDEDRARYADTTSKRDDIDSITKAKMINAANKNNSFLG